MPWLSSLSTKGNGEVPVATIILSFMVVWQNFFFSWQKPAWPFLFVLLFHEYLLLTPLTPWSQMCFRSVRSSSSWNKLEASNPFSMALRLLTCFHLMAQIPSSGNSNWECVIQLYVIQPPGTQFACHLLGTRAGSCCCRRLSLSWEEKLLPKIRRGLFGHWGGALQMPVPCQDASSRPVPQLCSSRDSQTQSRGGWERGWEKLIHGIQFYKRLIYKLEHPFISMLKEKFLLRGVNLKIKGQSERQQAFIWDKKK